MTNNECDERLLAMSLILLKMQDLVGYKKRLLKALKTATKLVDSSPEAGQLSLDLIAELNLEEKK